MPLLAAALNSTMTPDEPSDDELIHRARQGARPALVQLLERHGPAVRRQLEGKVDPRWRSVLSEDDILQETYADALLGMHAFQPDGAEAFPRWLARIARNNLVDAVRELESLRQGGNFRRVAPADPAASSAHLLEELRGTSVTASTEALRQEAAAQLHAALAQLPHAYREVVRRYDLESQSASQVATALGCSQGAMYMRRARALELLRTLLATGSSG